MRTLLVPILCLVAAGCDDHCYTPGHCAVDAPDTGWWQPRQAEPGPPSSTVWTLAGAFEDGAGLAGFFEYADATQVVIQWSICAYGSPDGGLPAFKYTDDSSEAYMAGGQLHFVALDGSRDLVLEDNQVFDPTRELGQVRSIRDSWECPECDHARRVDASIVASDPWRPTWIPCP